MKQQNQNICSTKETFSKELEHIETEKFMNPPIEKESMNQIFCKLILIDKNIFTIYIDLTGNYPSEVSTE